MVLSAATFAAVNSVFFLFPALVSSRDFFKDASSSAMRVFRVARSDSCLALVARASASRFLDCSSPSSSSFFHFSNGAGRAGRGT